jgi:hypothetical protein
MIEVVFNGVPQGRLGNPGQAVVRRLFTKQGMLTPTPAP